MKLPREIWFDILLIKRKEAWLARKKMIHKLLSSTLFLEATSVFDFHRSVVTFYRSVKVEVTIVDSADEVTYYMVIYPIFVGCYNTKVRMLELKPYSLK
jgi:hypothetical protein